MHVRSLLIRVCGALALLVVLASRSSFASSLHLEPVPVPPLRGSQEPLRVSMTLSPSDTNRTLQCPVRFGSIPQGYVASDGDLRRVQVDTTTIPRVLPQLSNYFSNVVVILVKRDVSGKPYFKYLSTSDSYDNPVETWSSSKIFAAMNGAGKLREDCPANSVADGAAPSFDAAADGGLNQFIDGKLGRTPLGDLATVICSYEEKHYTSNALANWFEMVGGRDRMNNIIKGWLDSHTSASSSLGGAYGMPAPSDLLNFKFYPPASGCQINGDNSPSSMSNTLSALEMAELTKRIVMARELPQEAMPSTTWADSETLLYGARPGTSVLFPGRAFGGMAACEFPINTFGVDLASINAKSGGKWRAFGKDGFGCSTIRSVEERLFNGYACYPFENKASGPANGVEFIYSTRLSIPGCPQTSPSLVTEAAEMLNRAILDGRIQ